MKIIIIGAGLLGVSTAYFLAQLGAEVVVLERREAAGLETSYANSGVIHPSMSDPWNTPGIFLKLIKSIGQESSPILFRLRALPSLLGWGMNFLRYSQPKYYWQNAMHNALLANYSLEVTKEMKESLNLKLDSKQGSIMLFRKTSSFERYCQEHEKRFKACSINHEIISRNKITQLEPALADIADDCVGAIYYPDDLIGDAYKYCQQVTKACQDLGVVFRFNCDVQTLEIENNTADAYVIAAGSYSAILAKPLGIHLPVKPVKGYSITLPMDPLPIKPTHCIIDVGMSSALTPLGNHLRTGGTAEFAGYDTTINAARIHNLVSLVQCVYPRIITQQEPSLDSVRPWAGLRPMTPDGVPFVSSTHLKNVYVNTGHGQLGWTMAAGSGKLLAAIITHQKPDIDPKPYALDR